MNLTRKLNDLDTSLIGTEDYMGYAYFWDMEYKHYLRNATFAERQKVHKAFLKAGLNVSDASSEHMFIVQRFLKEK